jgi:hypothetical protein
MFAAFIDPVFVVWRCISSHSPSKTFGTTWEKCFTKIECLQMDWKIKKWLHKCYAWGQNQTPVHGHNSGQHWACKWHGSVRQIVLYRIVLKGWARIDPALALQTPRSIVLPILDYPFVNPTVLMKCRTFLMGGIMIVARFHEVMTHVMKS